MKKLLGIVVLGLLLSTSAFSVNKNVGTGELQLSDDIVEHFIHYIKLSGQEQPSAMYVTEDGLNAQHWLCPYGSCQSHNVARGVTKCEQEFNKTCKLFARRRTIKWHNGINSGKRNESTFKSKWSKIEIRAKLTELGFLGGSTSASTTTTPKITKKKEPKITKKNTEDNDIVNKIKDLKELFDSGVLTKEEFDKAKKKLLN